MKYVIIGNSAAAVGCVEGIRSVDREGEITVVSREGHHTYSRPLISYLLLGKTDREKMKYRPDSFYSDNGVRFLPGRAAVEIDPAGKTVTLDDGACLPYDKLLVATGSHPFVPPIEGLDGVENRCTFSSLDDALALEALLTPQTRVLILGAGLIGLKCAEGIAARVASVSVVDMAGRVLPSILDETAAALVQKQIEKHGVRFFLSRSVERFCGGTAVLTDKTQQDFDVLVVAVGVRPNVELVQKAGGAVGRGVTVDERCATTLPDIYAAGDCTESLDITTGERKVLALLPGAYMQGEAAGVNMAGGEKLYDRAIPMNAIGFFGYHMITAGSYDGEEYVVQKGADYKKLVTGDGVLKGYLLLGSVERAGIYTALIRNRTPLASVDFDLIKEKPQLMAFSKTERLRQLGSRR
ncbi:MAG: FAD-dependent oxidoreductase [Oscillospiraceae bacterium]|nr:FAD-dependent oxidoreductase [Oscillospiraceae bacterium]